MHRILAVDPKLGLRVLPDEIPLRSALIRRVEEVVRAGGGETALAIGVEVEHCWMSVAHAAASLRGKDAPRTDAREFRIISFGEEFKPSLSEKEFPTEDAAVDDARSSAASFEMFGSCPRLFVVIQSEPLNYIGAHCAGVD